MMENNLSCLDCKYYGLNINEVPCSSCIDFSEYDDGEENEL